MRISLLLLAAPGLLLAQLPRVGLIEIYGLNKVSEKSVNTALGIHAGDPLPAAKAPIEDRLAKLPGVAHAWIEAFCCVQDQTVLYVGIEARESHHFELHAAPAKEITLSPYITNAIISTSTLGRILRAPKRACASWLRSNSTISKTFFAMPRSPASAPPPRPLSVMPRTSVPPSRSFNSPCRTRME